MAESVSGYGWEKLYSAVRILAGSGSQKERLVLAVIHELIHIKPEEHLPKEMRDEFEQFMKGIQPVDAVVNEKTIEATVSNWNESQVKQAVLKIIDLYDKACRG